MGKIRPANSRATRGQAKAKKWVCSSTSNPETMKFRSKCNLVAGTMKPLQKEPGKKEKKRKNKPKVKKAKPPQTEKKSKPE